MVRDVEVTKLHTVHSLTDSPVDVVLNDGEYINGVLWCVLLVIDVELDKQFVLDQQLLFHVGSDVYGYEVFDLLEQLVVSSSGQSTHGLGKRAANRVIVEVV